MIRDILHSVGEDVIYPFQEDVIYPFLSVSLGWLARRKEVLGVSHGAVALRCL